MKPTFSWLWNMAWRDSRRDRARLLLFSAAVTIGVAALVAIDGFGRVMQSQINNQAKELLGADLELSANRYFEDSVLTFMDSLGGRQVNERTFSSMVYFPEQEASRPVQVHALEPGFPFYGQLGTVPVTAGETYYSGRKALVDQVLMQQIGARPGDSIKVGTEWFTIEGALTQVPGRNEVFSNIYAPVYIPFSQLESTDLLQKGSRVNFIRYFQLTDDVNVDGLVEQNEERFRRWRLRTETVTERKEELGEAFGDLTEFLQVVAFVSLLLGGLGVGSAVHVYVQAKVRLVAVLRCLGATGRQAFSIYLIQVVVVAFLGALGGSLAGTLLQIAIPEVLGSFLPVQIPFQFSWPSIALGVGLGTVLALLFALPPLLRIRRITPLVAIRASADRSRAQWDWLPWIAYAVIFFGIYGLAYLRIGSWLEATILTGFLLIAMLVLAGVSWLVVQAVRKLFPQRASYLWRQALANLFRPQNQTLLLVLSIGLGTWGIGLMFQIQHMLLSEVDVANTTDRPNIVAFDVRKGQTDSLISIAKEFDIEPQQIVPIVTIRLEGFQGRSRTDWLADTAADISRGALNREYRVTYRDSLIESETLTEGTWYPRADKGDTIWISVEEDFAKNSLKADLGDEVVFDVGRVPIKTYIGSFRKVDWQRVQTNFFVVFPAGVLENAPQFSVMVGKSPSSLASANFQQEVVQRLGGVSVIDLGLVLRTIEQILEKVSFVVRFMAWVSILTGLLVLAGSVWNTQAQRRREAALLRTIGATRRQVEQIQLREYVLLGLLASMTGIGLAVAAAWGLTFQVFTAGFSLDWQALGLLLLGIPAMTALIGWLGLRRIVNQSPLVSIRREEAAG